MSTNTEVFVLNKNLRFIDKLINYTTLREDNRVKGYCGHCDRPVFNLDTAWCKQGLCVWCWEMKQ